MASATVGVHVHAEPARLLQTLDALAAALPPGAEVVLLPDGPDAETTGALGRVPALRSLPQWATPSPAGPPACFNRLAARAGTDVVVLLESGACPAPDALVRLLRALDAPDVGLAGPSTNRAWNEQGALPSASGTPAGLAAAARTLSRRHGDGVRPLGPLYSLGDFCLAVRADVLDAVGAADEGFGLGPCWEMEYSARAARAGFTGVWVGAAFVHRAPATRRRRREEPRRFEASRRRYQDRLCGLRLDGTAEGYQPHCRGEACEHFAPAGRIAVHLPLPRPASPAAAPAPRPQARVAAPLVSCVMPTADRPGFVAQALRYLRRQEHPAWELVVVDDGAQSTREVLADDDPRVRWVRLPSASSIGRKRNVGCERARGEFIAHWDDDDWHGPTRLGAQLAPLRAGTADVCALRDAVWFDVPTWRFRSPTPALHRSLFVEDVHGGTLVYRRSVWERGRGYPDRSLAEDALFLAAAVQRGSRLTALPAAGLFLYVRHGANTWQLRGRPGADRGWQDLPEPAELAGDREFYAALRWGAAPAGGSGTDGPLVSCLMPTADRRAFVPAAVRCFLDQTYAARELVVVDDGDDPVDDLLPDDPRIRHVRLHRSTVLGTKRNIAVDAAAGDLLAHWDDDDWSHPARLARQVAALSGTADVCGLDELLWWQTDGPRAWRYRYGGRRAWVAGNTLAYRRDAWRRSPFRPQPVGEDTAFQWGAHLSVQPMNDISLVVGTIHPGNTSPKATGRAGWSEVPLEAVLRIVGGSPACAPAGPGALSGQGLPASQARESSRKIPSRSS